MTNRTKKVLDELTSTMKINPDAYSLNTSPNRVKSLGYALAGWLYMLRFQKNTRIMSVSSVIIFGLALWLRVDFMIDSIVRLFRLIRLIRRLRR